jgi:hypothetical protein
VLEATFDQLPNDELVAHRPVPFDDAEAVACLDNALVVVGWHSHEGEYAWTRLDVTTKRWSQMHVLPGAADNYLLQKTFASDGRHLLFTRKGNSSFVAKSYLIDPAAGTTTVVNPPRFGDGGRAELWFGPLTAIGDRFVRVGFVGNAHGENRAASYVLDARTARWVEASPPPRSPADDNQWATPVGTPDGVLLFGGIGVEGGEEGGRRSVGALHLGSDPGLQRWQLLPPPPIDLHRVGAVALWTGREVLLWGGATALAEGSLPTRPLTDGARWSISR